MKFRSIWVVLAATAALAVVWVAPVAAAEHATYHIKLDAPAPDHEPWGFYELFPHALRVHRGDIVDAGWDGSEAPHTATFVPTPDAAAWRQANQGPGGPWALVQPDSAVGGDDPEGVLNPSIAFPSSFTCGSLSQPCAFNASSVVNAGFQFSVPGNQPSFAVRVTAPVGRYSILCLLHPGMQIPLDVVTHGTDVPSPLQVANRAAHEQAEAIAVDGPQADAEAQQVTTSSLSNGHTRYDISAGGFFNQASANEYVDGGLSVNVGDKIRVTGLEEIHTATLPIGAASTTPLIKTQCEVPGPDTPANSPADCADPSQFQLAFNNKAVSPASSNQLSDPSKFRNSGLLAGPVSYTFVAKEAGTYTMVCLVHGPEMNTTITVSD